MVNANKVVIYCQNWTHKDFQYHLYSVALFLHKTYGFRIQIVDSEEFIKIGNHQTRVLDCQLMIHYEDLDIVKGICYCDADSPLSGLFYHRNNPNDIFIHAQSGTSEIRWYDKYGYKFKFIPLNYLPEQTIIGLDNFYIRRLYQTEFIDKMVFRGNVGALPRTTPTFLLGNQYFDGYDYLSREQYFDSLTKYKVGLSIPGVGEICHRDVEYMAIGIPFIKFEFLTKWSPELIPNYHYISIDRIDIEAGKERYGGEVYAELYIKRFLEVKDDKEFLDFISTNSRKYYYENLHPLNRFDKLIKLIDA